MLELISQLLVSTCQTVQLFLLICETLLQMRKQRMMLLLTQVLEQREVCCRWIVWRETRGLIGLLLLLIQVHWIVVVPWVVRWGLRGTWVVQ